MEKRPKRARKKQKKTVERIETITFNEFFSSCVRSGQVRSWQKAEIWAFFKDNNLNTDENIETYKKVLKSY